MLHVSLYLKNLVELVDLGLPSKERLVQEELGKDAAHRPHVHSSGVLLCVCVCVLVTCYHLCPIRKCTYSVSIQMVGELGGVWGIGWGLGGAYTK